MTQLDQHIISSLDSLSEDGKDFARKVLGLPKPKKKEKQDNSQAKKKMFKSLFNT